ncbi:DUF4011 domain-containing protein [Kocuria sp. p3-SID1433]|uniref:DUF4011 domain-containing protein n=1 Tax=unclassified Kocuria TaxID=2649579 RepID=UPI0021A2DBD3|nr:MULTISPECIES: DUF4011 domain-containing protein [unclassified Kocuria]MCT1601634.1 DUF4011 domain-containing protein [Kocuria sp. p3-SID1428]MCT2179461.1 DUF4011 domain-containing protein [Kocuria sp. p3-SID1433]
MISAKPYETVLQAGQVLAHVLRPFIERHSPVEDDPQSWLELIGESDFRRLGRRDAEYALGDPRILLKTIAFHTDRFAGTFTANDVEWAMEALKMLNLAHHGTSLGAPSALRGIESMQLLLESVGATEASRRLEAVSEGIYPDFASAVEGLPSELNEIADPELTRGAGPEPVTIVQPIVPIPLPPDQGTAQEPQGPQERHDPEELDSAEKIHPEAGSAADDEWAEPDGRTPHPELESVEVPRGCRAADFRHGPVGVRVIYREALNFALIHNQVSPIVAVHAIHDDQQAGHLVDSMVVALGEHGGIEADPLRLGSLDLPPVPENRTLTSRAIPLPALAWHIAPRQFAQIDEATTTTLRINVSINGHRQTQSRSIQLLARDEWYARSIPEILAAFVTPNSPALVAPLQRASELLQQRTGSNALDGYQQGAERAEAIGQAIYDALAELAIGYITPPASFEESGQKIRRVEGVLQDRLGTCLDLSVLYAAALEQAGLNPVITAVPGHAFAGFLTEDDQLAELALSDVGSIDNVVRTGRLIPVETTGLTSSTQLSFEEARKATARRFDEPIDYVLDIAAAHRRVKPLPRFITAPGSDVVEMHSERPTPTPLPTLSAVPSSAPMTVRESEERLLPPRIQKWRQSLLDLSLRNPLLNLPRRAMELIVPERSLPKFEDTLADGQRLLLRAEDDLAELGQASGRTSARELGDEALHHIFERETTIHARVSQTSYGTSLDKLRREAKSALDETGANRLFVTLGALSWKTTTGREALAPLFLLPASLEGSKKHRFHLTVEEGAIAQPNWALIEKLRSEFALSISVLEEPPVDDSGIDLPRVIHEVRSELARQKLQFSVRADVRLSLLKFSTVDMWRDLGAHWERFMENPVVKHLVESQGESFHDSVEAPPVTDELEAEAALPVQVDGSQLKAIRWASAGKTFVLEGPPGTGKSQTITNMIADTLSRGKTVLFVAEKQAALDVVRTRLERVGLGPLILQMHGSKQKVTEVRRQLLASWDAEAAGNRASFEAQRDEYRRLITSLSAYPKQLHGRDHAPLSVWQAHQDYIGMRSRLGAEDEAQEMLQVPGAVVRDPLLADRAALLAERLESSLRALQGIPASQSPWSLAGPARDAAPSTSTGAADPSDGRSGAMAAVRGFLEHYDRLGERGRELLAAYPDPRAWEVLAAWLAEVNSGSYMSVAHHREVWARTPGWDQRMDAFVAEIQTLWTSSGWVLEAVRPESRDADTSALRSDLSAAESRFLRKERHIKQVIDRIEQLVVPQAANAVREDPRNFLNLLDWAQSRTRALQQEATALLPSDVPWTPWDPAARLIPSYMRSLSETVGAARGLFSDADLEKFQSGASTIDIPGYQSAWQDMLAALGTTGATLARWQGDDDLRTAISRSVRRWRQDADKDREGELARFRRADRALEDFAALGFEELVEDLRSGRTNVAGLQSRLRLAIAREQLETRLDDTELSTFDPHDRSLRVDQYREASDRVRRTMRQELPAQLLRGRGLDRSAPTVRQVLLRKEIERRRGGSIRRIFELAGSAVTDVTPCLLMSPSSVAKNLPVGSVDFDLVIFDEASQIRVADAIGSLGRAKSVVIVGDSKQMPPSSMFATSTEDEDDDETGVVSADQESILSEAVSANIDKEMLTWHYRSQDESLIAFSNGQYYDGGLSTFPAPPIAREGFGIRLVQAGGVFDGSTADKGHRPTRTNKVEAQLIVQETQRRLEIDSSASIGIVTFNIQQQDLIQDLLEESTAGPVREALAREIDPLIVKNLENIQGDERDVILFSLAFSPNPESGRMRLMFGPLSAQGGERRLNVAITRARREVVLFASFDPEHIDLNRTGSTGMRHLRAYLEFAREQTELGGISTTSPSQELHRQGVAAALRASGLEVVEEYGMSRFQVDMAVRVPESEVWFAVMLDGPAWAQRAIVSDRDAVPSQVLTMMGWSEVLQVWLPSWWSDRDATLDRLVNRVEERTRETLEHQLVSAVEQAIAAVPETPSSANPTSEDPAAAPQEATPATESQAPRTESEPARELEGRTVTRFASAAPTTEAPLGAVARSWAVHRLHEVPFVEASTAPIGDRTVLDRIEAPENQTLIREQLWEIIDAEGPIEEQRLVRILGSRFGLQRVVAERRGRLLRTLESVTTTYSRGSIFYWSDSRPPAGWTQIRTGAASRKTDEIPTEEFQNALLLALRDNRHAMPRSGLLQRVNELFGIQRMGGRIREAQEEALSQLIRRGVVEELNGMLSILEGRGGQ